MFHIPPAAQLELDGEILAGAWERIDELNKQAEQQQ